MKSLHEIPKDKKRPTLESEIRQTLHATSVQPLEIESPILQEFLARVRGNHLNGGAHLFCFAIGPNETYDFYEGRNGWSIDAHIDLLLEHPAILSNLGPIKAKSPIVSGLNDKPVRSSFELDSIFAQLLYDGGAYWKPQGDGREAKEFAVRVCDEMFGLRYGEVSLDKTGVRWTPWFYDVAWDLTIALFDKRLRRLWLFALTDTD